MRYKITKLKAIDNPTHGSFGYSDLKDYYEGVFIKEPIVGERFNLYPIKNFDKPYISGISTSPVTKIIDENTFETLNSVYRIDKIIEE